MILNLHELIIRVFELFDTNPLLMTTLNWDKHSHSQLRDDKNSRADGKCKCFETKTDSHPPSSVKKPFLGFICFDENQRKLQPKPPVFRVNKSLCTHTGKALCLCYFMI